MCNVRASSASAVQRTGVIDALTLYCASCAVHTANEPPSLEVLGDNPLIMDYDAPFLDPGVIASDDGLGDLTSQVVVHHTIVTGIRTCNGCTRCTLAPPVSHKWVLPSAVAQLASMSSRTQSQTVSTASRRCAKSTR